MLRHDQTTRALVEGAGWSGAQVETTGHWDEIDHLGVMRAFGETPEDKDPRAFQAAYERALRRWMTDGSDAGRHESFVEFTTRVTDGLRRAAEHAGPGQTAVVVTSAGPISVACAALMHPGFPDLVRMARAALLRGDSRPQSSAFDLRSGGKRRPGPRCLDR